MTNAVVTAAIVSVGLALVGCGSAPSEGGLVDWDRETGGAQTAATSGCYDKPGSPRQWIQVAPSTAPASSRLRISDPCGGSLTHLASVQIEAVAPPLPSTSTFLVTQNWNPHGAWGGTYNAHPIGIEYDGTDFWIRTEDNGTITPGASFNIALDALTTVSAWSKPTYPLFIPGGGSPDSIFLLTHYVDPPNAQKALYAGEPIVEYVNGNWRIENADGSPVGAYESFNVSSRGTSTFTATTVAYDYAYIDPPITDPEAIVFVTQRRNPPLKPTLPPSPTTSKPIGVWYDDWAGKWAVFNEDGSAMPVGVAFNVWNP